LPGARPELQRLSELKRLSDAPPERAQPHSPVGRRREQASADRRRLAPAGARRDLWKDATPYLQRYSAMARPVWPRRAALPRLPLASA
jgi:hypothetical protein